MKTYRLPDRKGYTKSVNRYIKAWRELGRPIAEATDAKMFGWDPGLLFARNGGGPAFNIDSDVAISLYKALTGKEFKP